MEISHISTTSGGHQAVIAGDESRIRKRIAKIVIQKMCIDVANSEMLTIQPEA